MLFFLCVTFGTLHGGVGIGGMPSTDKPSTFWWATYTYAYTCKSAVDFHYHFKLPRVVYEDWKVAKLCKGEQWQRYRHKNDKMCICHFDDIR